MERSEVKRSTFLENADIFGNRKVVVYEGDPAKRIGVQPGFTLGTYNEDSGELSFSPRLIDEKQRKQLALDVLAALEAEVEY